jgi:hypothetical protein
MHTTLGKGLAVATALVIGVLAVAPPAWSADEDRRRGRDRGEQRADDRHRDVERRQWQQRQEAERRLDAQRRDVERRQWEQRREAERRQSEWRRAADRREWERRRDLDRHRAAASWRFDRGHGWRFEQRPGIWSPFFVWWAVDGRPALRPYPTVRIVRYPTGYYELFGDGIAVPYYWVWRPTVVVATPPPVPLPPPPPVDYPLPADGYYPPPPTG